MAIDSVSFRRLHAHGVASALPALAPIATEATVCRAVAEALGSAVDRLDPDAGTAAFELPRLVMWRHDRSMIVLPTAEADSRPLPHAIVLHRSVDPADHAELAAMLEAVRADLGPLGVDRIAMFVHGPLPTNGPLAPDSGSSVRDAAADGSASIAVSVYKRYSAASIEGLKAAPRTDTGHIIESRCPTDLGFYEEYQRMYDAFWRDHPGLGAKIGIESRLALDDYAAHGGLRLIFIDGALAGVAAAIRHAEFGLRGWRVRERVLAEGYRGAGLGATTLRTFIESLDHEPGDLVWGTILPENVGSRRSAEKLGRIDVGGLVWVHDPG